MKTQEFVLITVKSFLCNVLNLNIFWFTWFLKRFSLQEDEILKIYRYVERIQVYETGKLIGSGCQNNDGLGLLALMALGGGGKKMTRWWNLAKQYQIAI